MNMTNKTSCKTRAVHKSLRQVRRDKAQAAREKELLAVRGQFDKARITWESKERELEARRDALQLHSISI